MAIRNEIVVFIYDRKMKLGCFFLITIFFFAQVNVYASIKEKQERLSEIQKKVKLLEKQVKIKEKKEKTLFQELLTIKKRLKTLEKQEKEINDSISQLRKEIAAIQKEEALLAEKLIVIKRRLNQRLFAIYKWKRLGVLSSLSPSNFKQNYLTAKYFEQIMEYDWSLFERYQSIKEGLELLAKKRLNKKEKLQTLLQKTKKVKDEINKEKQKKRVLLKKIKLEKKRGEKRIAALKASAQRLENLIKRLKREQITPQKIKKGSLDWPVNGNIVVPFGRYLDKDTSTYLVSNGIEIQVPYGTPFKAVAAGKVVFANKLQGYGYLIILDHGRGYYTLYGNAISLYKKEGEWAEAGEILGVVGKGGAKGVTLYFELRHKEKPVNPFTWLKPARYTRR